jgi:hypothetical protein
MDSLKRTHQAASAEILMEVLSLARPRGSRGAQCAPFLRLAA